jgi:hypothetical protein
VLHHLRSAIARADVDEARRILARLGILLPEYTEDDPPTPPRASGPDWPACESKMVLLKSAQRASTEPISTCATWKARRKAIFSKNRLERATFSLWGSSKHRKSSWNDDQAIIKKRCFQGARADLCAILLSDLSLSTHPKKILGDKTPT